jgi:hypothetical protein
LEQPFRESFLRAFARGILIFGLIVFTLAVAADNARARAGAPYMGFVVATFYFLASLNPLRKAYVWAGRGGPVQRLVPHAKGRAYGFLAAVLSQVAITVALLFLR